MKNILNMPINEMVDLDFDCTCGKHHTFPVHDIDIKKGAINDLPKIAAPFKDSSILVVFDNHTYEIAGKKAVELLKANGFSHVKELLFDVGDDILLPDEKTLGRILQEEDLDCELVIGVGSGVINDSCKFVTSRTKLPYIIVSTAPSMDGYVADGAPIISHGYKYSPLAHLTYGLIGDTDILKTAPQDLIQAGFGDVVGKITALTDWDLAVKANGDDRCDTCVQLVDKALDKCFSTVDGLPQRDPEALGNLMEALTISGVAMGLVNISRPASGAEHMLSHYWEMDYIARGLNPNHHGIQVGVATPVIARIFELCEDILPAGVMDWCASPAEIKALLKKGGAPTSPKEIGIDKDLFHRSIVEGYKVRPRYSILQFAKDHGRLEIIADILTEEIYGNAKNIDYSSLFNKEERKMKIAFGCDPNATDFKKELMEFTKGLGYDVVDYGSDDPIYANVAFAVAKDVANHTCDRGILLCGTGIGVSIAANKVKGAYAACIHDVYQAQRAELSNNANIITMGSQIIGINLAKELVKEYLSCTFDTHSRSMPKVQRIIDYENDLISA